MNEYERGILRHKIEKAKIISFDIFDTLLFRKTNTPEKVFDLVGKHFGIHGFRKLRMDGQNEASRRAYIENKFPHANMEEIYKVLAEHKEIPIAWNEVKEYEIQLERDALVANKEMLEIFKYAKALRKRVVATSDMYLTSDILSGFLTENGFIGFDYVYCSADERKAKFNKDLFEVVAQKENVAYEEILHIGDKERDDGEYPGSYGIQTYVYDRDSGLEKMKDVVCSDVDNGLYNILYDSNKSFFYNLGVEVGGPLYMGLYRWLLKKSINKKIFLLARDGYNLYHILRRQGFENIEYFQTSRRSLTLACITEMNERDVESLPPYTYGQTVSEILEYLCIEKNEILHLGETGLKSFDQVIKTKQDINDFKKLYYLDKEVFLRRCEKERENALLYFNKIGFLDEDAVCFDCGWQGSSQELIEQFKKVIDCHVEHSFIYFGIKNSDKSRKQLKGLKYDSFLFDFYKNYCLQDDVNQNVVMYELFFSAPHESVFYYGENGEIVYEAGEGDYEKEEILEGISDFIGEGIQFVEKYEVEYTPEISVGHLKRLIHFPTIEEAIKIGNLKNVDGFARKKGETKHIAFITEEQLECNPDIEIYWPKGLLKRPDVSETLKVECAKRMGIQYPYTSQKYNLEDEGSIRNYHRWLRNQNREKCDIELSFKPKFSVVIPVYNTVSEQLEECIQSVLNQTYHNFELILVDDCSSWKNVRPVLQKYESDNRVQVIFRTCNGHISIATNDGISRATGDYIVFMDCDDIISLNALYEFARKLNDDPTLDFIYSDEDKITEDGKIRHQPFFKPDWSPDLFLNMNYTNHLSVYRSSIVKELGGLRTAYNGAQDYDFTLRFMEKSSNSRVGHIPKILYHWRERKESIAFSMNSKNYATEAARCAKEDYIRRNKLSAKLESLAEGTQHRIVYNVAGKPLVSIIIPSKDHPEILRKCIDSVRKFTTYQNYEFIVVDNGSNEKNRIVISNFLSEINAKYIYYEEEFNFSRMCNLGVAHASGEYLLFLNDDIEVFQNDWLERMLGQAQQKHVGAVGAKLFYPQTTIIQHAGVANLLEGPSHNYMLCEDSVPYYFYWNWVDSNCIAVTAACMLVKASKFTEVGGFDEKLEIAYNDVKLCFALHKKGYYNIIRNDVVAYHYESLSRGTDQVEEDKLIRLNKEKMHMYSEFKELKGRDPYLNDNLHNWSIGLDLKQFYDNLFEIDLTGCQQIKNAMIDFINISDKIQIMGWSILECEAKTSDLKRFVVFKDPFGGTYAAETMSLSRPDVAEYFENSDYVYSGFECVLRDNDLKLDILPYQIGILIIDQNGKKYLKWCRETDVIRKPCYRPIALQYDALHTFEKNEVNSDVRWYVDECERYESYYRVRGFAYKCGNQNFKYIKSLVLVNTNGNAYEFQVHLEERIDVAYSFPNEHFLYYTGFVCYIFDGMLEKNSEYELIIRLRNQFNNKDVQDITTEQKIIV